jgi:hypothetical protein
MKQMAIDTILLEGRSSETLWPVVFNPLTSMPMLREQEAMGSIKLQALHWLDKIHTSLSCSLIQSSICCLMLVFVSGLFLKADPGGWSAL